MSDGKLLTLEDLRRPLDQRRGPESPLISQTVAAAISAALTTEGHASGLEALRPLVEKGRSIPTGTESRVCQDIAIRQAIGTAKYGTTVESNPLPLKEWLQHAYEECLDKAIYLKRAIEELEKSPNDHGHTPEGR